MPHINFYRFTSCMSFAKGNENMTIQTAARLVSITPQFLVLNLQEACDFYTEKLGFRLAFTYEGFYAGVERDGMTMHLKLSDTLDPSRHFKQHNDHLDVYFTVDDVDGLFAEFQSRGVKFVQHPVNQPWGTREFVVWDNNGYILYFGGQR